MLSSPVNRKYGVILATALACLLAIPSAGADEKTQTQKQLKTLQGKIEKLKNTIHVKQDTRSRYTSQLRKIEGHIGKVGQKIRVTETRIKQQKSELKNLRSTRKQHQEQLLRENDILGEQIYTAFTLGRQEKIKLLFSQQSAYKMQRNLVYYQYFSSARVSLINQVENNITKILATESSINITSQDLERSHQQLKDQKQTLEKDGNKRKNIISSLDKQLKEQGGHLNKLNGEAEELQKLLDSIEKILTATPAPELSRKAFAKLRGKLAWPVNGKVRRLFGYQKPLSRLRWQGVIIQAPTGRHVKAISHGRVAFADWLRGLGNLVIIDHGNSYLSLYGHNESLFKSAGEWVEPGDIIGSIGSSGGQEKPGLYFEIRRKGKPQNPTKWCKSKNQ
ncbi:MAG: peptidoglycan DD-metalloendopeptidase family protein, partial [Gammaproteobacteria bacterium]|nr:peptidoglycan DD-metalloendopeptidase family protein [Gammaproteobacteria bacterium]